MDFAKALRISGKWNVRTAMRMNTISSNIANINTTQTPEGGPYRRKDVVFEAIPDAANFGEILTSNPDRNLKGAGD